MKYSNIHSIFDCLNENCSYIVLRNWDNIFDENIYGLSHEDIDILCDDLESFVTLTGAVKLHTNCNRDNYIISCGQHEIRFDIRWIGDGYYPAEWERQMLCNRILIDLGIYIPSLEDYFYSLAYHALFQKQFLSDEYLNKLQFVYENLYNDNVKPNKDFILDKLKLFLRTKQFLVDIPNDPAVFLNWRNVGKLKCQFRLRRRISRIVYSFGKHILSIIKHLSND